MSTFLHFIATHCSTIYQSIHAMRDAIHCAKPEQPEWNGCEAKCKACFPTFRLRSSIFYMRHVMLMTMMRFCQIGVKWKCCRTCAINDRGKSRIKKLINQSAKKCIMFLATPSYIRILWRCCVSCVHRPEPIKKLIVVLCWRPAPSMAMRYDVVIHPFGQVLHIFISHSNSW